MLDLRARLVSADIVDGQERFQITADARVVDDLWGQFESQGTEGRHLVEVGEHGPEEVAEEIDRRFRSGEFLLRT